MVCSLEAGTRCKYRHNHTARNSLLNRFHSPHSLAYRAGVTQAITPPSGSGFFLGVSTAFASGATGALERGAIAAEEVALHVRVSRSLTPSVSTQIAVLRRLVFSAPEVDLALDDISGLRHAGASAFARVRKVRYLQAMLPVHKITVSCMS